MSEKDTTGLEAKRDELLAEVKDLKAKLKDRHRGTRRSRQAGRGRGAGYSYGLRVDNPVNATLDDLFTIKHEKARRMLGDEYQFKLTDEGIKVFKGDEEVAPLDDTKALKSAFQRSRPR